MFSPLDKLLVNPTRLMIVSVLAKVENCDFNYLKQITETTQGNLSVQLKKLKESDYISIDKRFENNYPKTSCSITKAGLKAFDDHFTNLKNYQDLKL
ncbi:transcriptional regulator [Flavobacteriaceae bacterium]|jgi:DNA-binding transcriptional ArsR family regulator|nr:transcriptional regulator [Flavobacteriaceae bacterium]MDG1385340.1 transcriptional regulator [Flavobacteriaceae bacterium]